MEFTPINLQQLIDYSFCGLYFYWRHVIGEAAPARITTLDLVGKALSEAWTIYLEGQSDTYPLAVMKVWQQWLMEAGTSSKDVMAGMVSYGQAASRVLEKYESGKTKRSDGGTYVMPRRSRRIQNELESFDLKRMGKDLEAVLGAAIGVETADYFNAGPYYTADAFSDSFRFATALAVEPNFPTRDAILDAHAPVLVKANKWLIPAEADLVVKTGKSSAAIEVHDYDMLRILSPDQIARDIRFLAAYNTIPEPESKIMFEEVNMVVFRQIPFRKKRIRRVMPSDRLPYHIETAIRGIQSSTYLAQSTHDNLRCQRCPIQEHCLNPETWSDFLDGVYPGLAERASAVQNTVKQISREYGGKDKELHLQVMADVMKALIDHDGLAHDMPAALAEILQKMTGQGN